MVFSFFLAIAPLTEQLTVIAGLLIRHGIQSSIPLGGTSIDVHSTAERIVSEAVNELRGESMTDKVEAESVKTKESSLVFLVANILLVAALKLSLRGVVS